MTELKFFGWTIP